MNNPEKQWVGNFIFRLGNLLNGILPRNRSTKLTDKQSPASSIIQKSFPKTIGKIPDWEKTDFRTIKKAIKINIQTTGPDGEIGKKIWTNIRKSSRSYKRVDLNYLAAHTRLPLARFLHQKQIARSDKCRLCYKESETQEHLFYTCCLIQELKRLLISDLNKIDGSGNQLTYNLLMTHTPNKSPIVNEYLSIFKQSIWQLRGAVFYTPALKNLKTELKNIYAIKVSSLEKRYPRVGVG